VGQIKQICRAISIMNSPADHHARPMVSRTGRSVKRVKSVSAPISGFTCRRSIARYLIRINDRIAAALVMAAKSPPDGAGFQTHLFRSAIIPARDSALDGIHRMRLAHMQRFETACGHKLPIATGSPFSLRWIARTASFAQWCGDQDLSKSL